MRKETLGQVTVVGEQNRVVPSEDKMDPGRCPREGMLGRGGKINGAFW